MIGQVAATVPKYVSEARASCNQPVLQLGSTESFLQPNSQNSQTGATQCIKHPH